MKLNCVESIDHVQIKNLKYIYYKLFHKLNIEQGLIFKQELKLRQGNTFMKQLPFLDLYSNINIVFQIQLNCHSNKTDEFSSFVAQISA